MGLLLLVLFFLIIIVMTTERPQCLPLLVRFVVCFHSFPSEKDFIYFTITTAILKKLSECINNAHVSFIAVKFSIHCTSCHGFYCYSSSIFNSLRLHHNTEH